ncbi:hypothetical protein PTQ19_10200 [Microbacterium esteraromaticum]|uniref:hypothetical protein n=1 Tax=Microbacterium esteraromaticum TaxID=57043 RepID=UPI002367B133|nr:hypothetical protein [Microbacterium esteraromaticum]WDH77892.1 hypothetical protein PTQ19_10200 [Microbacterium esteraromaticum]
MAAGLPWVRMDTDTHANPKVLDFIEEHGQRALAAIAVWKFAIEYSGGHGTDGVISRAALRQIHGTPVHARLLVEGGFFEVTDKGWLVSGYDSHQPTRDTVEAMANARSERARKAANARWGNDA